jgi:uncharacterized protein (TIGR00369 family)
MGYGVAMGDPSDAERVARLERMNRQFIDVVPFNRALGVEVDTLGDGTARFRLPYRAELAGNPATGVLHGGAITALLDACCGAAVFMKLQLPLPIATLDLRIDYLGPATAGRPVIAESTCYKVTRHVAFVRGSAFHDDDGEPIATASGTFMLATQLGRRTP